jgi:hypothetical protein
VGVEGEEGDDCVIREIADLSNEIERVGDEAASALFILEIEIARSLAEMNCKRLVAGSEVGKGGGLEGWRASGSWNRGAALFFGHGVLIGRSGKPRRDPGPRRARS